MKSSEGRVVTCGLGDDFIAAVSDFLMDRFRAGANGFSRVAVVFGGRRPALFLNRELAHRMGRSFSPPRYFSMDEFIQYAATRDEPARCISPMDAYYLIYRLVKKDAPSIARGREEFSQFLPWSREIASFIELLDLEDVSAAALRNVQAIAAIGYDVPESANELLLRIAALREAYHRALRREKAYSRGLMYLLASRRVKEMDFPEFDKIIFCNLFRLRATEATVVRNLYERDLAVPFFQGDEGEWPALKRCAGVFGCDIRQGSRPAPPERLSLWAGFDTQSQAAIVRTILKETKDRRHTVVVLPDSGSLIPLLSEIAPCAGEFNVSMGYPLTRSAVHSLFESIVSAQVTRKGTAYYAKDYLRVITHPLLKNMKVVLEPAVTRVLVHKVEELLSGAHESPISGSLFVTLEDVMKCAPLYHATAATLGQMEIELDPGELPGVLRELHDVAFGIWEGIGSVGDLSHALERFVDTLVNKSHLERYFVNLKVAERILALADELRNATFSAEPFAQGEVFRIVTRMMEQEIVSFSGSPLKGLQVLGLLETRSLNFRNVIIMDVNETVLPRLHACEPLIPRQVMVSLGLNRMEEEEEIQRYHFMRLLAHAEEVHLIYDDRRDKERSRFIEELVWERQKTTGKLQAAPVIRAGFRAEVVQKRGQAAKDGKVAEFLERFIYSPTSLDAYLACPLSFYFAYVLGLGERDDLLDEPKGSDVGTFIHNLLRDCFAPFRGKRPQIDSRFREEFFREMERRFADSLARRMRSDSFMLEYVMRFRLGQFLDGEATRGVSELLLLEERLTAEIPAGKRRIRLACRVDRIDRMDDGSLLIIDYKTGANDLQPRGRAILELDELSRETIRDTVRSFQLPLYYRLVRDRYADAQVRAALYNLRTNRPIEFPAEREAESCGDIMRKCMEALTFIIEEILSPDVPFRADEENKRRCAQCPFFYLCR